MIWEVYDQIRTLTRNTKLLLKTEKVLLLTVEVCKLTPKNTYTLSEEETGKHFEQVVGTIQCEGVPRKILK